MTNASEQAVAARRFLKQQSVGVLSTISVEIEGYPFGSITPYTLSNDGEPILLLSDIAQHTRNIRHNPKVSLTIFDLTAEDVQASARLTWIGDTIRLPQTDTEARRRYLSYFPSAESYFAMHDFALYRIELRRARFIGGFGQIFWIEPDKMILANPLREIEAGIIEHMNQDHYDALVKYCQTFKGVSATNVYMVGIDSEGFDLLADKRKLRFDFDTPVMDAQTARAVLVKMARAQ
ncbi:MAG: DUF2470 domain-containing protein [Acidobacteriota bacterium]